MQGLIYNFSVTRYLCDKVYNSLAPKFGLSPQFRSLKFDRNLKKPQLVNENWVELQTVYSGICGSDLNMLMGKEAFSMEPYASFPCVLGHENIAKITKRGSKVTNFEVGDYVIVNPALHCEIKELPKCEQCLNGHTSLCQNFYKQNQISAGMSLGYNKETSGGWAEFFQAHHKQLIKYEQTNSLELATLVDPLASAIRPVLKAANGEAKEKSVFIYGAGTIGLLLAYAIEKLELPWKVSLGYRHSFQASLARKLLKQVELISTSGHDFIKRASKSTGATTLPIIFSKPNMIGGFDTIFDCAGTPETLDNSLRLAKAQAEVILVATASSMSKVDPTPLWQQEIKLTGSCMSGDIVDHHGEKQNVYELACKLLSPDLKALISHQFPITEYKQAIEVALNKKKYQSTKVIFSHKGLGIL